MVVSGTNKKISLWNKDGIRLGDIGEMNDWIWSNQVYQMSPDKRRIFAGSNSGHLKLFELEFKTVHGLYEDRYA